MKTNVNHPKVAKEASSGSTALFQGTSPTTLVNKYHKYHNHKYHKIFNKNNVEIRYSCMANIKSIINMQNMHNKDVVTEKKTQTVNCNCINKAYYPFPTNVKLRI